MRNPIAFVRRVREALQSLDDAERFATRVMARMEEEERRARMASGRALCPVCQHGEIALVFGALDDQEGTR